MRRWLAGCLLLVVLGSASLGLAAVVISERDWQLLKSMIHVTPLTGFVGTPVPATCTTGQIFFDSSSYSLNTCGPDNTWSVVGGAISGWPTDATTKVITWANNFVNSVRIGDGTDYWAIYRDSVLGLQFNPVCAGVENDCNFTRKILSGRFWEITNSSNTSLFRITHNTGAITNATLDTEATGNNLTLKNYPWRPFASCQAGVASTIWDLPSTNAPVANCKGTNITKGVLEFPDGATDLSAYYVDYLNEDWTGAIDAVILWESTSTSTNNVLWSIAIACAGDGESSDPAFTDDDFTADANKGTASQYNVTAVNTVATTGTCTAGKLMHVRVKRRLSQAGDTLAATAQAVGLSLKRRELH